MKKLSYLVFLVVALLSSCSSNTHNNFDSKLKINQSEVILMTNNTRARVTKFTYDGHNYISINSRSYIVDGIVHDPDCPCHNK